MAASKKTKNVINPRTPLSKEVKIPQTTSAKQIAQTENPDSYYRYNPAWNFHTCDDIMWPLDSDNAGDLFWKEILPCLKMWESFNWQFLLVNNKKLHHSIDVKDLSKLARDRLTELFIEEDAIISLRLNGTHRIYGYIQNKVFNILWFDKDHGDNDTCVCRSHKKHT